MLYQLYFHHVLPLIGRLVSGHRTAYQYLPDRSRIFPSRRSWREDGSGRVHEGELVEPVVRSRRDPRRRASPKWKKVSLDNISQFLSAIDRIGELARISEPVKARLELCEIADRVMKQPGGGNALSSRT